MPNDPTSHERVFTRRTVLKSTAVVGTAAVGTAAAAYLVSADPVTGEPAQAVAPGESVDIPTLPDGPEATPAARAFFRSFFTAKTRHAIDDTHAHFHPERMYYADAVLGWAWPSNSDLRGVWETYMPQWPAEARSYPTRILGDTDSAIVLMTNTPELFGGEIRAIAIIDLEDGKIVRWVDYWDGRNFGADTVAGMRTPAEQFPELGEQTVRRGTPHRIDAAARRLQDAFEREDVNEAEALFSYDAVFEDMTLRTAIRGPAAITRYLQRALADLPYGRGTTVRHTVGSDQAGGYEWGNDGTPAPVPRGAVALELDSDGAITRLTTVWDGSLLSDEAITALTVHAAER
jgi:ketosteroid isomerase-like protein